MCSSLDPSEDREDLPLPSINFMKVPEIPSVPCENISSNFSSHKSCQGTGPTSLTSLEPSSSSNPLASL